MILSSQLGDFAAVSDLLKATEAPLLGCRDVTEPSIKPSRHVVGILNVNIQKGKNAEREKSCQDDSHMLCFSADEVPRTTWRRYTTTAYYPPLDGDGNYRRYSDVIVTPCKVA